MQARRVIGAVAVGGVALWLYSRMQGQTIPEILGSPNTPIFSTEDGGATPTGLTYNVNIPSVPEGFGTSGSVAGLESFASTPTKKSSGGSSSAVTLRGLGDVREVGTSSTGATLLADRSGNVIPASFNTRNLNTSTPSGAISSPAPSRDVASRSTPAAILSSIKTKKEKRISVGGSQ